MKNSIFGHEKLCQITLAENQDLEWGEKVWLEVVPTKHLYFLHFLHCWSLKKKPKNAKIGHYRLFCRHPGFHNDQIGQIFCRTCLHKLHGQLIRHFVAVRHTESKNCIKQRFWALKVAPWTTRPIAISCVLREQRPTDRPTDRQTDQPTNKAAYKVASTRPKNPKFIEKSQI